MIKRIALIVVAFFLLNIIVYGVFIYFFTKEADPISVYTFSLSYEELEEKISEILEKETYLYNPNDNIWNNNTRNTR